MKSHLRQENVSHVPPLVTVMIQTQSKLNSRPHAAKSNDFSSSTYSSDQNILFATKIQNRWKNQEIFLEILRTAIISLSYKYPTIQKRRLVSGCIFNRREPRFDSWRPSFTIKMANTQIKNITRRQWWNKQSYEAEKFGTINQPVGKQRKHPIDRKVFKLIKHQLATFQDYNGVVGAARNLALFWLTSCFKLARKKCRTGVLKIFNVQTCPHKQMVPSRTQLNGSSLMEADFDALDTTSDFKSQEGSTKHDY